MILDLDQGSKDWHLWRAKGIGGSDAPAILGESPYQTPYGLWREKTGRSKPKAKNAAMAHGLKTEQAAREKFFEVTGIVTAPACVMSDKIEWMRTSLDGLSSDGKLGLELKCPVAPRTYVMAKEGSVPMEYTAQCYHNIAAAGLEKIYFAVYYEGEIAIVEVEPDYKFLQDVLLPAETEFWGWVVKDEFPMPTGMAERKDREWVDAATAWLDYKRMSEETDEQLARAELMLQRLGGRLEKVSGGGVRAYWQFNSEWTPPAGWKRASSLSFQVRRGEK